MGLGLYRTGVDKGFTNLVCWKAQIYTPQQIPPFDQSKSISRTNSSERLGWLNHAYDLVVCKFHKPLLPEQSKGQGMRFLFSIRLAHGEPPILILANRI